MSWEDQGRQQYGWFGHGTGPTKPGGASDSDLFGPDGRAQRIRALAYGAVAALPPAMRSQAAAQNDSDGLDRLTSVMTAWSQAARLDGNTFAAHFLGRAGDDPVTGKLREAVLAINLAQSHDELRHGAERLAEAQRIVGLDRWPRFLAEAETRARDPATLAAVEKSQKPPDPRKDAIRPVYPVETALGIGAAAVTGGAAAAARAAGGAILRQVVPKLGQRRGGTAEEATEAAAGAEKPAATTTEPGKPPALTKSSLPANPDDLLTQGWKEMTHPKAGAEGHRTFVNQKTGQIVEFDKARPGEPRWGGRDHYHWRNPDSTNKHDRYLDKDGRAVRAGSEPSHLLPGR